VTAYNEIGCPHCSLPGGTVAETKALCSVGVRVVHLQKRGGRLVENSKHPQHPQHPRHLHPQHSQASEGKGSDLVGWKKSGIQTTTPKWPQTWHLWLVLKPSSSDFQRTFRFLLPVHVWFFDEDSSSTPTSVTGSSQPDLVEFVERTSYRVKSTRFDGVGGEKQLKLTNFSGVGGD
jgi:hypothetical protein